MSTVNDPPADQPGEERTRSGSPVRTNDPPAREVSLEPNSQDSRVEQTNQRSPGTRMATAEANVEETSTTRRLPREQGEQDFQSPMSANSRTSFLSQITFLSATLSIMSWISNQWNGFLEYWHGLELLPTDIVHILRVIGIQDLVKIKRVSQDLLLNNIADLITTGRDEWISACVKARIPESIAGRLWNGVSTFKQYYTNQIRDSNEKDGTNSDKSGFSATSYNNVIHARLMDTLILQQGRELPLGLSRRLNINDNSDDILPMQSSESNEAETESEKTGATNWRAGCVPPVWSQIKKAVIPEAKEAPPCVEEVKTDKEGVDEDPNEPPLQSMFDLDTEGDEEVRQSLLRKAKMQAIKNIASFTPNVASNSNIGTSTNDPHHTASEKPGTPSNQPSPIPCSNSTNQVPTPAGFSFSFNSGNKPAVKLPPFPSFQPADAQSTSVPCAVPSNIPTATSNHTPTNAPTTMPRDVPLTNRTIRKIQETIINPDGSVSVIDDKDPRVIAILNATDGMTMESAIRVIAALQRQGNSRPTTPNTSHRVRWSDQAEKGTPSSDRDEGGESSQNVSFNDNSDSDSVSDEETVSSFGSGEDDFVAVGSF